jgi:hypothetical protein
MSSVIVFLMVVYLKIQVIVFYLMVILDGMKYDLLMTDAENIYPILEEAGAFDVLMPNNAEMAENWWKVRRSIGETVKQQSIYKEEDTVVPRASLPELLTGVKEIGKKYNFRTVCYGHAGDGNLHVNILKDNLTDEAWENEIPKGAKLKPFSFVNLNQVTEEVMLPSPGSDKPTLTMPRDFNLMFTTLVGAMQDASSVAYLCPEMAQGIFINYKNVLGTSRLKLPFGIAQIGKAFRNEITPRNFIFRSREFEQMEIEYFIPPYDEDVWGPYY